MKDLRTKLLLTQQELALLTGVSVSVISMYEKGLRSLPARAGGITSKMYERMYLAQTQPVAGRGELPARAQRQLLNVQHMLKAHARKAADKQRYWDRLLGNMRLRYDRLTQKLAFIQGMMQEAGPDPRKMELLKNMETRVLQFMDGCGPAKQLVLEYRLSVLKARQEVALQMQAGLPQKGAAGEGGPVDAPE